MKKVNGYFGVIQLVTFLIMAIYFLAFRDSSANAEMDRRIEAGINEYKIEIEETVGKDLQILKLNMKRSLEAQGLTWIE